MIFFFFNPHVPRRKRCTRGWSLDTPAGVKAKFFVKIIYLHLCNCLGRGNCKSFLLIIQRFFMTLLDKDMGNRMGTPWLRTQYPGCGWQEVLLRPGLAPCLLHLRILGNGWQELWPQAGRDAHPITHIFFLTIKYFDRGFCLNPGKDNCISANKLF